MMTTAQADRRLTHFRLVYLFLTANFVVPVLSYIFVPSLAESLFSQLNVLLGASAQSPQTQGLWYMLAIGNVATLGFTCAYLLYDLKKHQAALIPLAFLKSCSALFSVAMAFNGDFKPAFIAVFFLDGSTTLAMLFFAIRAIRALPFTDDDGRFGVFYPRPGRADARLEMLKRANKISRVPTAKERRQIVGYNLHRIFFRSENIGTSSDPIRKDAGLFRFRFFRFWALAFEHGITPLDLTGLCACRQTIIQHLLTAHHDGDQFLYDLELLECEEGALAELQQAVEDVISGHHPKSGFFKKLTVFEGYHQNLLAGIHRFRAGHHSNDPELSLIALINVHLAKSPQEHLQMTQT